MFGSKRIAFIVYLQFIVCSAVLANKSVFIISNHGSSYAQAYAINGDQVTLQGNIDISNLGIGAVGTTVWPEEDLMFITYENSGIISWASIKTLAGVGDFDTSAGNLAGIVVNRSAGLIYVMRRENANLYVYSFDESNNTLILETSCSLRTEASVAIYGMGLALDEIAGKLYVTTSSSNKVYFYDTNDLTGGNLNAEGHIDIVVDGNNRAAIGIAVDPVKRFMFTGDWGGHNYLVRTQLDSPYTSSEVLIGSGSYRWAAGVAVEDESGNVYVTTGPGLNQFRVYDSNLVLKDTEANNISGPAGVAVGGWYKTSSFSLVKDNNDPDNGCVDPNNHKNLTYDIFWDVSGHPDTNMVVTDQLPEALDYNSSEPNGEYDWQNQTVTWNISGNSGHIVLNTNVNEWAKPCHVITNAVIMEGNTYLTKADCNVDVCPWGTQIIYADWDANGYNNGTDWNDAYNDLQDALSQARNCPGCATSVWVSAGTYKPVNDTNDTSYKQKSFELLDNIALIGHFPPTGSDRGGPDDRNLADVNNETILDGKIGGSVSDAVKYVVKAQNIESAVVDGFTIKDGFNGAGIYLVGNADVSIVNCIIKDNDTYGIQDVNFSSPDMFNCKFVNNSKRGLYIYDHGWPEVSSCIFDGNNRTECGVYMSNLIDLSIADSSFKKNLSYGLYGYNSTLTLTGSSIDGGSYGLDLSDVTATVSDCNISNSSIRGIWVEDWSVFEIKDCSIKNSGSISIYGDHSVLTVNRCIIDRSNDKGFQLVNGCHQLDLQNSVIRNCNGNGLELSDTIETTIKNNWIHNNGSTGISFTNQSSIPLIRNNTIYNNGTYGIWSSQNGADPNIINCIISGNDANDLYRENGNFNTVNYCLLQHPHSGNGNITGDPCFMNVIDDPNDLHIANTSQCRNAGDPNGNYGDEQDIDNEPRIAEGRVDIGGDEYYWSKADYDTNGIVNFVDFAILGNHWLDDQNSQWSIDGDNDVDIDDLKLFCDDWLWQPVWMQSQWMTMSGESSGMSEMVVEIVCEDSISPSEAVNGLMLPDVKASMAARPARLKARTDKFYEILPQSAKSPATDAARSKAIARELLKNLEDDWNFGDLKNYMSEENYLSLRSCAEQSASAENP